MTEDVLRSPRISKEKPQTISYQFYSTNNYKNFWVISGQKAKPGNFYKLDLNETINVTKSSLHVSTPLGQSRICLFEVFLPDDKLFDAVADQWGGRGGRGPPWPCENRS